VGIRISPPPLTLTVGCPATYHLALAAQSLSFVRTLVAFLRARYLGLLPPRHAVFVSTAVPPPVTPHRVSISLCCPLRFLFYQ